MITYQPRQLGSSGPRIFAVTAYGVLSRGLLSGSKPRSAPDYQMRVLDSER